VLPRWYLVAVSSHGGRDQGKGGRRKEKRRKKCELSPSNPFIKYPIPFTRIAQLPPKAHSS
jgi:hypothetical protein